MLNNINIIATYLVRNDHDILADSIEHHLNNGVDALIITEHKSSSETSKILDKYNDHILHRTYENSDGYNQSEWVTKMARIASRFKPKWIIHCDADELWCDLDSAKEDAQAISTDYWYNYFPYSIDEFKVSEAKNYEYASESSLFGPGMYGLRKVMHRPNDDIVIYQGNHACSIPTINSKVRIKHYPIRTYKQFESKVIAGSLACSRHPSYISWHWRNWYKSYTDGKLLEVYKSFIRV